MLTTVPRSVLNTQISGSGGKVAWTILYDGILSELCGYCENPVDSHFNFHALTVMQICFQQVKTSIVSKMVDRSGEYDPIPEEVGSRVLKIVWNNLEDPLSQTVKQVHLIFDLFLDVQIDFLSGEDSERVKVFLGKIASNLLMLGPRCKGRYVPLASITRRLGARKLLDMSPKLLVETVHAYVDDDVCCAATSFLKCFLELLRDECWSSYGIEKGYEIFRGFCLPPLMQGLVSGLSKLRSNLNTYALPTVLEVDVDSIFPMLAYISIEPKREETKMTNADVSVDQCVAALVSLLKVSRVLAFLEGDIDRDQDSLFENDWGKGDALISIKGIHLKVPVQWLVSALTHADDHIRTDAAETLFLNPKTASLPSALELQLMRKAVPLNMRCCSTAFQMKWTSLFRKFFARVKTALDRQVKQGVLKPGQCSVWSFGDCRGDPKDIGVQRAIDLFAFMKWLSSHMFFSCYPSAPYERKMMSMALILILVDVWPAVLPAGEREGIYPYNDGFVSADSTLLLVGSVIDSWDRLRESSYSILSHFPTPLPGISNCESVKEVITWAKKLVCSPRVRESDAGALTLRIIFKKYVMELGWIIGASVDVECYDHQDRPLNGESKIPVVEYLSSLVDWLRIVVEDGEEDLPKACKNSFVHGILLALRYTFEEMDWNSATSSSTQEMKSVLEKLLELIRRITSLALWVVSADAWYLPTDDSDTIVDMDALVDASGELDAPDSLAEAIDEDVKPTDEVGPAAQVVMVGCWLAMKEVSLLLGTIVRKIPLPVYTCYSSTDGISDSACEPGNMNGMLTGDEVLDVKQLESIGSHFLQVLLKMKHNGAIDKTRAGFTALCNRLLNSNDPRLCKMAESWLEQLMERTTAKGQTVDDLLRRSAGIPAAFIAIFLSEPEGTPKKLLPRALQWLIDVVKTSSPNSHEKNLQNGTVSYQKNSSQSVNLSKTRDEGVVPLVHSFNVLRVAFNDTNLATDTSGFAAEALIISIRSFSSPYWEVRNSACLAYTALVRRMIGFLNVHKRESARRALTGIEFFHRYPPLHPFLCSELKVATELLLDETSKYRSSDIAKAIHPSLCPILILLSRLKPSLASSDPNDVFDPFLLMPFISRCATQNNLRVRVLASRALTGLVSNERLLNVVVTIANALPNQRRRMEIPINTCPGSSCVNGNCRDSTTAFSSYNAFHGILLQLTSLINSNCRNLSDNSKKGEIFDVLIPVLVKSSWLGSFQSCPCPTLNASFLCILDHMLDIARVSKMENHIDHIQSLLEELSLQHLERRDSTGVIMFDPTEAELHKQVTASYFNCLFGGKFSLSLLNLPKAENSAAHLEERLMFCLCDPAYEVRLAVLKQIMRFLKSMKSTNSLDDTYLWIKTSMQPSLMQMLDTEGNFKCIYHILRIIFEWNLLQFENNGHEQWQGIVYLGVMDCDSILDFWKKLVYLSGSATHSKVQEALLKCMGICIRQLTSFLRKLGFNHQSQTDLSNTSIYTSECDEFARIFVLIDMYVSLVKQRSAPAEPVNMRMAAAESLVSSGLLKEVDFLSLQVSNCELPSDPYETDKIMDYKFHILDPSKKMNMYAKKVLDAWSACIHMLEDEDVGLRLMVAKDAQNCICQMNQANHDELVPAQVERVIELCFEFLSSAFGHWIEYVDYLSQWNLAMTSHSISDRDLVRQVFDKEIDNHHEEKLLICQICCMHLEKLLSLPSWVSKVILSSVSKSGIVSYIQKWRLKYLQQLIHVGTEYLEVGGRADWIGGIGNHKDVFVAIYGNLLGLYAFFQCKGAPLSSISESNMDGQFFPEFEKIEVVIQPFLQNPLISNLYSQLARLHGIVQSTDSSISSTKCSDWEDFDPYFLLR